MKYKRKLKCCKEGRVPDPVCVCEVCGQEDLCLSTIQLRANYGSIHDGERITLHVCGDCIDRLFDLLLNDEQERIVESGLTSPF